MRVRIFDTTLRDGEQTPGISLSPAQKLAIAERLDRLGVDAMEAGFPVISAGEAEGMRMIVSAGLSCDICGLARANRRDIDAVADAGATYVHTFIATSDIHLEHKLRMSREEAAERAVSAVEYAKSRGLTVEFSAEDATRTDRTYLDEVFSRVAEAGADRIDIPDTVGYSTPSYMASIVSDAVRASGLPVSVHCHNDFGLAVANALAGIQAGAECAHVTINGIGERAGNASLEELVMALRCLQHGDTYETGIIPELLYETSKFVSRTVGVNVQPNKAIVGDNAFGHESGIHTHGVLSNPLTYEPIGPEMVGRKRWLKVGKHAGLHGTVAMLREYGVEPDPEQSRTILDRVKEMGDAGRLVTDVELLSIADEVMDEGGSAQPGEADGVLGVYRHRYHALRVREAGDRRKGVLGDRLRRGAGGRGAQRHTKDHWRRLAAAHKRLRAGLHIRGVLRTVRGHGAGGRLQREQHICQVRRRGHSDDQRAGGHRRGQQADAQEGDDAPKGVV